MITRLSVAGVVLAAGVGLLAAQDADSKPQPRDRSAIDVFGFPEVRYPVVGMTTQELAAALNEIGRALEPGTGILDIRSLGGDRLEICTGTRNGPLGGTGFNFVFERKNGRWIETRRTRWAS